jgi:hypothetical protein
MVKKMKASTEYSSTEKGHRFFLKERMVTVQGRIIDARVDAANVDPVRVECPNARGAARIRTPAPHRRNRQPLLLLLRRLL